MADVQNDSTSAILVAVVAVIAIAVIAFLLLSNRTTTVPAGDNTDVNAPDVNVETPNGY